MSTWKPACSSGADRFLLIREGIYFLSVCLSSGERRNDRWLVPWDISLTPGIVEIFLFLIYRFWSCQLPEEKSNVSLPDLFFPQLFECFPRTSRYTVCYSDGLKTPEHDGKGRIALSFTQHLYHGLTSCLSALWEIVRKLLSLLYQPLF